ncbi:MAG: DUF3990 domain-containing protein [Marinilabiliaceae bacterium]|nr:DUF3990 domain-containing protein [Marinilabiliaceae bacterium]
MKVYHGSYTRIETINLSQAEENKDFGKGFYVTNIQKHAERWAERIAREHNAAPVVTEFMFYETAFSDTIYKVLRFPKPSRQWVEFVMMNRDPNIPKPAHHYDIVEGPIANDWVTSKIKLYEKGKISMEYLIEKLTYRENTHQICLCTTESLSAIKLLENIGFPEMEEIAKLVITALTESGSDMLKAINLFYSSHTFTQLADRNSGLYLKPWQDIFELMKIELLKQNDL